MKSLTNRVLGAVLILFLITSCSSPISPIEDTLDGLFILKVTKNGVPAGNAEVFAITSQNTLKETLRTNQAGILAYDPDDETLPQKLIIRENGFTIAVLQNLSVTRDTFQVDLSPATPRNIQMVVSNSYAESAFTVGVIIDGFMIDTLYAGSSPGIPFEYGLPDGDNTRIELLNPAVQVTSQSNNFLFMVSDIQDYRKMLISPYLKNSSIPAGTKLYNGVGDGFPVMSDGWVWYRINPAMGNEENQQFEIHGNNFSRIEFTGSDVQVYQNLHIRVFPFKDQQTVYEPLFNISEGDIWKFDVETFSFFSGSSRTREYELTWTFEMITSVAGETQYTVTETAVGTSTGPGAGPIDHSTIIIITENEMGTWSYAESSHRSLYSLPLTNFNQYFVEQPGGLPENSITVKTLDGSNYITNFGRIGRLAPVNVESVTNSYERNRFEIDRSGIIRSESRLGVGNSRDNYTAVRI